MFDSSVYSNESHNFVLWIGIGLIISFFLSFLSDKYAGFVKNFILYTGLIFIGWELHKGYVFPFPVKSDDTRYEEKKKENDLKISTLEEVISNYKKTSGELENTRKNEILDKENKIKAEQKAEEDRPVNRIPK